MVGVVFTCQQGAVGGRDKSNAKGSDYRNSQLLSRHSREDACFMGLIFAKALRVFFFSSRSSAVARIQTMEQDSLASLGKKVDD